MNDRETISSQRPRPLPAAAQRLGEAVWQPGVRVAALVGTSKNSGKTTTLNALLADLSMRGERAAVVSIGLDGEDRDAWLDTPKPWIYLEKDTLVATAASLLAQRSFEVVADLGIASSLGPTVVARARGPQPVQLAGIAHRGQLIKAVAALRRAGADKVVVDGAYHRQAAAHPEVAQRVVVSLGAILGDDPAAAVQAAAPTLWAMTRPAWPQAAGTAHALAGALTDGAVDKLPIGLQNLVVQDPSRILLGSAGRLRLERQGVRVWVRNPVALAAITLNPHRPGGLDAATQALAAAVRAGLGEAVARVPLLDVVSGWYGAPEELP
ncbi:MAG: hypothetical protein HY902_07085 [Deltaproteobacteria bacterium]|nr:hypothetical protein [Deltaproteobacteria bacterium]